MQDEKMVHKMRMKRKKTWQGLEVVEDVMQPA